jgi:hypothetical protein
MNPEADRIQKKRWQNTVWIQERLTHWTIFGPKRGKVARHCVDLIEGDRTMFGRKRGILTGKCLDERERENDRKMFGRNREKLTEKCSDEREGNWQENVRTK